MQTHLQSIIEVVVGTLTGFIVSVILTYYIFGVSVFKATWVTVIFTIASVARQYAVRRLFNRWHK